MIVESTRKLVGNLFELEDLGEGPQGDRGVGATWDRAATGFSRKPFRGFPRGGLTELIGRQEELNLVLRRLDESKNRRRSGSVPLWRVGLAQTIDWRFLEESTERSTATSPVIRRCRYG